MITNNFKNKMLKAVRDSIYCFSFKVENELKERYPHSTEIEGNSTLESYGITRFQRDKIAIYVIEF